MTSASTKVSLSINDQFSKFNRDIMPACIATSYPRINNDVYNREYTRDRHVSDVSSPEPQMNDDYPSQFPEPSVYPGKLLESTLGFSSIFKCKKKSSCARVGTDSTDRTKSQEKLNNLPAQNGRIPDGHETKDKSVTQLSPAAIHPIKKRINQKNITGNNKLNQNCEKRALTHLSPIVSPPPAKHPKPNATNEEKLADCDVSSAILQKMYSSFERNFDGHIAGAKLSNSSSNVSYEKINENDEAKHSTQNILESKTPGGKNAEIISKPLGFQKINSFSAFKNKKLKATGKKDERKKLLTSNKPSFNISSKTEISKNNERDFEKQFRKRKLSADVHTSPDHSSDLSNNEKISPNDGSKRSRYSSSESNDSQSRCQQNPFSNTYQQNGSWFPFVNPVFYPQASLNAFGLPAGGCHFPMAGFTPSHPFMLNPNSYLNNPVMMRDMFGPSGISNLMPLFAANTISHGNGFSPQQLQAIQQLQAALFYQNQSLFPPSSFPGSPAMLSGLQGSLFSSGQRIPSLSKEFSGKRQLDSEKCPSPDQTTFINEQEKLQQRNSEKEQTYSSYASFVKQKSYLEKLGHSKFLPSNKLPFNRVQKHSNSSKSINFYKKDDKFKSHSSNKQRQNQTSMKKKSDKKTKDTAKLKDSPTNKDRPISNPSDSSLTSPDKIKDSTKFSDDPLSPARPESGKSPSYKNLTRERRLVANARERTRVHTISSAFDELRDQIPSYSCNQKLSKLAILRIACEYIRTLSVLAGHDETLNLTQGVDRCTKVLQSESRARSRRKNNKTQIEMEMVNFERHKSRDELESEDGFGYKSTDSCFSSNPTGCSSFAKDKEEESQEHDDVVENDNELVDVESFDDDKTNDLSSDAT